MNSSNAQEGWRWCCKCEGLWFAVGIATMGVCPAGGNHSMNGSGHYSVHHYAVSNSNRQEGWRYCFKCQGLWYAGGGIDRMGICPAGGNHDLSHSGHYSINHQLQEDGFQESWRWCHKCEGLWFAGGGIDRRGRCPQSGNHDSYGSGNYSLKHN